MNHIQVVCAIIVQGEKVLCAKRSEAMSLAGFWEFPGGKIENNETEEDALKREIKEELGIEIAVNQRLSSSISLLDSGKSIELIPFLSEWESGELKILEHESVTFFSFEEAKKIKWAPADIPIFNELMKLFPQISVVKVDI